MKTSLLSFLSMASVVILAACSSGSSGTTEILASDASPNDDASSQSDSGSKTDSGEKADSGTGTGGARVGLEGFCDQYKTCGGSYYATAQACIDASLNYWGACKKPQLDAYGNCMSTVACKDYNPDAYNPSGGPCSSQWSALQSAAACK